MHSAHEIVIFKDWHSIFSDLSAASLNEDDEDLALLKESSAKAALATFVDAHNTGYYVNSYTTKLNPTMDGVLQRLLDGVRHLQSDWQTKEAAERASLALKEKMARRML